MSVKVDIIALFFETMYLTGHSLKSKFSPTKKPLQFSTGLRNRLQGVTSLSVENCKGSPKILFANVTGFCFSQPAFHTGGQLL